MPRPKVQRDRRQGGWVSRRSLLNRLSSSYPHHGERVQGPHPLGRGNLQHTPSRQEGKPCESAVTLVAEGESERFVNVSAPTRRPCSAGERRESRWRSNEILHFKPEKQDASREQNHHQWLGEDVGHLFRRWLVFHRDLSILHKLPDSEVSGGNVFCTS